MRGRLAAAIGAAILIAGCGGGSGGGDTKKLSPSDEKKLSPSDEKKLERVFAVSNDYCARKTRPQAPDSADEAELGKVNGAVADAIDVYKAHKHAKYTPHVDSDPVPLRDYMFAIEMLLGNGDCATDQANRIDDAISG